VLDDGGHHRRRAERSAHAGQTVVGFHQDQRRIAFHLVPRSVRCWRATGTGIGHGDGAYLVIFMISPS
jgi:hypothetical protein